MADAAAAPLTLNSTVADVANKEGLYNAGCGGTTLENFAGLSDAMQLRLFAAGPPDSFNAIGAINNAIKRLQRASAHSVGLPAAHVGAAQRIAIRELGATLLESLDADTGCGCGC